MVAQIVTQLPDESNNVVLGMSGSGVGVAAAESPVAIFNQFDATAV
jgi:hypothetical protein